MENPPIQNVWMLSREYGDLAGAGGVKDVVRQLADSLASDGSRRVSVVIPMYGFVDPQVHGLTPLPDPLQNEVKLQFQVDMDYGLEERREKCRVWGGRVGKVFLYLVESERFLEKTSVYTYTEKDVVGQEWKKTGMGHYDYFAMNVLLQKSSLELMVILGEKPDVIHCHDGHTALVPALIHECQGWRGYFRDTGCLVTIHNAGVGYHQEVADLPFAHGVTGLSWGSIGSNRLDGKFDPLLSAGQFALLNTVSGNYARELQETDEDLRTDWLGHTLLQRGVTIEGVTNGICPDLFSPVNGKSIGIPASYNPASPDTELQGKLECKRHLLQLLSMESGTIGLDAFGRLDGDVMQPLFTFIGRLSEQKGVDHFLEAIERLFAEHQHGQAVILGTGSAFLEAGILSLSEREGMQGRICFLRGYSPEIANLVYAAGDFFIIPSRYEPCGLTDYIAQIFGSVPVVHHVGGLVKVRDGKTGISYSGGTANALLGALQRALVLFENKAELRSMQRQAVELIQEKYTWNVVMKKYVELYKKAKNQRSIERG
jgi:starch synthase